MRRPWTILCLYMKRQRREKGERERRRGGTKLSFSLQKKRGKDWRRREKGERERGGELSLCPSYERREKKINEKGKRGKRREGTKIGSKKQKRRGKRLKKG